ncbi:MFS multidrug transporter-like protein [Massariosphaeria phaeospora]|uniref:MFS multidrug transporter-like protein n=1 Tax=Massariosphaeria phaeospora TaxID=100035 RepID=A0A7C8I5U7_9PLEO|nr:MFS multidrug transporter-like protein [Massariosphaeria phaeospora]
MAEPLHQLPSRSQVEPSTVQDSRRTSLPTSASSVPDPQRNSLVLETDATNDAEKFAFNNDVEKNASPVSTLGEEEVRMGDIAEATDPNIVWWDGEADPENPMNWPTYKRWGTVAVVSAITFLTPLASSSFAPGIPKIMEEFGSTDNMLEGFMLSVYVLGFAFGPLIIAPLSEMFGRLPLYHSCNCLFIIFSIAAAVSTNLTMFIIFRFFMGCFGGGPIVLGGGTIADLISREQRGTAMAVWMMGPTIGPCIGPVIGGFLTEARGWRWNFWLVAILAGAFFIASIILMRETSASIILERKAKRLRASTGNPKLRSKLDSGLSPRDLFMFSIVRPTKMLTRSTICFCMSLYIAITYAYLYILFTTFTAVFTNQYNWRGGVVGLSFLGLGVGSFLGQMVFTYYGNKTAAKHHRLGDFKPEHRLYVMAAGGFFLPIGLFWYGWSVQAQTHYMVPIIGTGFVGLGLLMTFMAATTYLVDVFTIHAASAMAASTVLRSLMAALIPLSSQKMYAALDYGWGNSLLGFVSLLLVPIPFLFIKYGERIRARSTVKL